MAKYKWKYDGQNMLGNLMRWAMERGFDPDSVYAGVMDIPPLAPASDASSMFTLPKYPTPLEQPAPAPYPWHADVLAGKVSIVGGVVRWHDQDYDRRVVGLRYTGRTDVVMLTDPRETGGMDYDIASLRPAPHDYRVGDTARVVSTAASSSENLPLVMEDWVGMADVVSESSACGNVRVKGWWVHPDDLLYLPEQPAAQPDVSYAAENIAAAAAHYGKPAEQPPQRERVLAYIAAARNCPTREQVAILADKLRAALDAQARPCDTGYSNDVQWGWSHGIDCQRQAVLDAVEAQ